MISINENQIACLEVIEVLKKLPEEQRNYIPTNVIENIQSKCGSETIALKYDEYNSLIISQKAKDILVYLYKEYFVQEKSELEEMLIEKLKENENEKEIKKSQNENFKVKFDISKDIPNKASQSSGITEYKENIFKRIINKFLNFFMR